MDAEVLFGLQDALFCEDKLGLGFGDIVGCFLSTDGEQLGVVHKLLLCFLFCDATATDGVAGSPPIGNGKGESGENHAEVAVIVEEVVVIIAGADGEGWEVLADFHAALEGGGFNLFLKELIFREVGDAGGKTARRTNEG